MKPAAHLAVLMLETSFPRPVGDIGNPNSHPFPVRCYRVPGADIGSVVDIGVDGPDIALVDRFVEVGQQAVAAGAVAIMTSCGFLVLVQQVLSLRLPVPVGASALLQVPWAKAVVRPGGSVGVITFDARALDGRHLVACGADPLTPVIGLAPDGALARGLRGLGPFPGHVEAEHELCALGVALCERDPSISAIVLECTNLPPYRLALQRRLGLPVLDSSTLASWLWHCSAARL